MHITDCWLYATLIFLFWGVKKCVSLNLFEGLSFSVNLSDLVCPLNVKESILFYSVQYLIISLNAQVEEGMFINHLLI